MTRVSAPGGPCLSSGNDRTICQGASACISMGGSPDGNSSPVAADGQA
jgi:hypothetical protein